MTLLAGFLPTVSQYDWLWLELLVASLKHELLSLSKSSVIFSNSKAGFAGIVVTQNILKSFPLHSARRYPSLDSQRTYGLCHLYLTDISKIDWILSNPFCSTSEESK
jgi:hypothetical protein